MKKPVFTANAQIISVYDGDTFKCRIDLLENREIPDAQSVDLGFRFFIETAAADGAMREMMRHGLHIYHEINVRMLGIYAPELREPRGLSARDALATLLPNGATVRLTSKRLDKYGRVEADVVRWDGVNINQQMVSDGHATTYAPRS
jgi:endonuclease YncB( thermonuclease family)